MSAIGYEDQLRKWIYLTAKDHEYDDRGRRKFSDESMYEAMENFVDGYAKEWERIYNLPGISEKEKDKLWKKFMIDTPGYMHGQNKLRGKSEILKWIGTKNQKSISKETLARKRRLKRKPIRATRINPNTAKDFEVNKYYAFKFITGDKKVLKIVRILPDKLVTDKVEFKYHMIDDFEGPFGNEKNAMIIALTRW